MFRDPRRLITDFRDRTVVRGLVTAFALLCSGGAIQAQPDEVTGTLPIEAVTVYVNSASITRSGEVAIPAGTSTLIIDDLPSSLNPALLQLDINNAGVQFSNMQIQESLLSSAGSGRENELREQLQARRDERQVIVDRIATAESELRLLENLTGGTGSTPSISGDELATLITVMSENSAQARERIRSANIELRTLDQQIAALQFQLDQVASNRRASSQLRISLQSNNAVSTEVSLTYPQGGVSWSWLYEARLETASRNLRLFRQVAITQGTGENWDDVSLTLSTATPSSNPTTPELQPLFVDNQRRRPVARSRSDSVEEVVVTGSLIGGAGMTFAPATPVDTRYQVDYVIPGRVSLAADRQQQIFPVDRRDIEVDLVSRAVPSRVAQAYLEARFDYSGETPVQNARLQLYRDGALVGSTRVAEMLPGQSVRLAFGVDQRIEVVRFDEQQESGTTGLLRRADVREERIRYEITSRHPEPVQVEVLDQVPVTRNEDISVQIPRQATTADETDVGGQSGLMLWQFELAPQETETIRHYYDIRYPQDSDIFISP